MLTLTALAVCFVLLSGLVAMVDAAVLSVSRPETEEVVAQGLWGALALRRIKEHLTQSVVVIVIVTNTINILGPILVGQTAVATYGASAIGWVTVGLTLGTIVFSEIVPKSLGAHYAPQIGRVAAFPILALTYALYPLVLTLDRFSRLFRRGRRRVGTEEQIRALTTLGRRAGYIEPDEGVLVHRAFVLNDRTAGDIMTPRTEVAGLQMDQTLRQALDQVLGSEFSRYPVFGESANDFRGVVLARDLLESVVRGDADRPLASVVREGLAVDADRRCDDLLLQFRLRRVHLAVVRRAEVTVGLVTLEDVLEELVGEIRDEKDRAF
jgi:CBS domain containing-hemolysin-like protein